MTAALSWKGFSVSDSRIVNAESDVASDPLDKTDLSYIQAGFSYPFSETLSLDLHYGDSSDDVSTAWFNVDNYVDYSLSQ